MNKTASNPVATVTQPPKASPLHHTHDNSSQRNYFTDLKNNLKVLPVKNPSYLCQNIPNPCNYFQTPADRQLCETSWTNLCSKTSPA